MAPPQARARARQVAFAGALVILASLGALGLFVMKMRQDALSDAATNASNLASILSEQVDRTIDAFDASLRATVRALDGADEASLPELVRRPAFVSELAVERRLLSLAQLFGVADARGRILGGAHGDQFANVNVADREYFQRLKDTSGPALIFSKPTLNRATDTWMIFIGRRIESKSGAFLGIVFIGLEPWRLLQTSHAITSVEGQSFGLFDNDGHMLVRHPEPARHQEIGGKITVEKWYETAKAGGGSYHSEGYFDGQPKVVAVRPLEEYPFVVSTSRTDAGALAHWRARSIVVVASGMFALALIGGLLAFMLRQRENLARAELRAWMRNKRLIANTTMLREVRSRFGVTLDYMSQGMAMFDADRRLIVANSWYARLYDIDPKALVPGMTIAEVYELRIAAGVFAGESAEAYRATLPMQHPQERLDQLTNGRIVYIRSKPTEDGGFVTVQEDVTERTRSNERLAYIALHDHLTGLPNRESFHKEFVATLESCGACALVLIDIDEFKSVNDIYGHEIGDRVLIELACRLQEAAPEARIARLGGDEFVALVKAGAGPMDPRALGKKLARSLHAPFACDGRDIKVSASMGAVAVGSEGADPQAIMRRADLALASAKRQGRDRCILFEAQMERDFDARVGLAEQLRAAIAGDELEVHYQPIIDALDGAIVCMEALVRWRHPANGMISPAVFIPLAEESGSIVELGEWVMRRACRDALAWPERTIVAVNVSSLQIARPTFAEEVAAILRETGLPPARLQIEITESVLLQNDAQIIDEFNALRDLGVTFALDDFGTGYASLGYLKDFPLDKIKIDKAFVDDICEKPQSIAIIGATVVLARGLSMIVTAEGVETREQFETLRALGVGTMQGYYFGRPRPVADQSFAPVPVRAA